MNPLEAFLWLTLNVYHEARGEDIMGQMAVAHVTINRARARNQTIKEVVLAPGQFSWTSKPREQWWPQNWAALWMCAESAVAASAGHDFTRGATHYHRISIIPEWTNRLESVGPYGLHHFWR